MAGEGMLSVQLTGLDALRRRIPDDARRRRVIVKALNHATMKLREEAMRRVPKRTGNTQRSITSELNEAALTGTVRVTSRVGLYLEKGTGLYGPMHHLIYPVNARALAWAGGMT